MDRALTAMVFHVADWVRWILRLYESKQKHSNRSGVYVRLGLTPKDWTFHYVHWLGNKVDYFKRTRQREVIKRLQHFHLKHDKHPRQNHLPKRLTLAWFALRLCCVVCYLGKISIDIPPTTILGLRSVCQSLCLPHYSHLLNSGKNCFLSQMYHIEDS